MAIDMHSHYYGGLVDALVRRTARPTITRNADGNPVLNAMTASTVMSAGYTEIPARLQFMDRAGLSTQLLTFPGALGIDVLPLDECLGMIRDFNDHLADICRGSSGRFVGLAGLPLADMGHAREEMRRARRDLHLAGAILPGNYFLTASAAETLRPVLEIADAEHAIVMVHPGLMPGELPPAPYADAAILRASALNLQASLSHMALTLVTNDFLTTYPDITFHIVNLGGTLPFILERIDAIAASRDLPALVTVERLRRMIYDTASLGPRAIEVAVKVFGADRIVLGTDYPIFSPLDVLQSLSAADISDNDRQEVAGGTASRLLRAVSQ